MSIDIFADDQSPSTQTRQPNFSNAVKFLLIGLAIAYFVMRPSGDGDDDGDRENVDVAGLHVLIVEETEKRGELTQGQINSMLSVSVREWLDENCAKVDGQPARLLVDSHTDISKHGNPWNLMREKATPPYPCVVVANDGKVSREDVRGDFDPQRMIEAIEASK